MSSVEVRGIRKVLGGNTILHGIDLDVHDGEFVVLVGPSGCGKSTLLRTIAGLETPDGGTLKIGGRDVTHAAPRERDIGMVFQSYALYPHLSVRDNLAFGLKLRGTDASTMHSRVDEAAKILGIESLLDRYPRQLSGGQRQRVAMGRAIARRPSVFLFDEPLSNLDAALRTEVRVEIKRLHQSLGATIIYVTHDQVEAMTLADRLVVLRQGKVEQVGAPLEVYEHPKSSFVAGFLGSPAMNFLRATLAGGRVRAEGLDVESEVTGEREVLLGVRPEHVVLAPGQGGIRLHVDVVERLGFETHVHGRVGDQAFVARLMGETAELARPGGLVELGVSPHRVRLFDPVTSAAL